jgi:hypothetical protein
VAAFSVAGLGLAAAPAQAAVDYIGATSPCSLTDVAGATACAGMYAKNGIAGTGNAAANQQDAFTRLGLSGTPTIIDSFDAASNDTSGVIDFGQALFGVTVISIHWGAGNGSNSPYKLSGGTSGVYVFDFLTPTSSVTTQFGATLSNARLFSTETFTGGVPEPATWALMILGFGGAGAALRRRRAVAA